MARDILLWITQVLAVLHPAPLIQGIIVQLQEQVQRAQGRGIFQPYRKLWKLLQKQIVPPTALWVLLVAVVAATCTLVVQMLIPVLTNFPLPLSDMEDIPCGVVFTLGLFMIILATIECLSRYLFASDDVELSTLGRKYQ